MSANWFAKKLGGGEVPPQQSPAPAYPGQTSAPAQYPAQQPQAAPVDPEHDPNAPSVTNLLRDPARSEQASKARKVEHDRCPGCGSNNYFSRKFGEGGVPLSMPPKGECFDCGYPTIQYGSRMGEGGTQEAIGGGQ